MAEAPGFGSDCLETSAGACSGSAAGALRFIPASFEIEESSLVITGVFKSW